jgi:hypothetical protein
VNDIIFGPPELGSEFEGDLRAAMQAGCGALSVL